MRPPAWLVIPETTVTKALVAGVCQYEVVAIGSRGRLPTITALNIRWPVVGVALLVLGAIHFYVRATPPDPVPPPL